jgi:hypothetical protein
MKNIFSTFYKVSFEIAKKPPIFALAKQIRKGAIAQSVEQRTENPCVPGSIPGGTTSKKRLNQS